MMRALLTCQVSSEVGVGHLSRLLALADALKEDNIVQPEFAIFGSLVKKSQLEGYKVHIFPIENDFTKIIGSLVKEKKYSTVVFDLYQKNNNDGVSSMFKQLKSYGTTLISVDSLIDFRNLLDLIWIPSFNFNPRLYGQDSDKFKSGWDSYLIKKRFNNKKWAPGSKILVLTGGSDTHKLSKILPGQLDKSLENDTQVHWVQGPFSDTPHLPKSPRLSWIIHKSPDSIDELIVASHYVLTIFGVSFFEVLQYGIPTVVFSPYGDKDEKDLDAISKQNIAMVSNSPKECHEKLIAIMKNSKLAKMYSENALDKMTVNGAKNLSNTIYTMMGIK